MQGTTNIPNGYQYAENARLFGGGISNAISGVIGSVTGGISSMTGSFMNGLSGIVSSSANVVGAISPEVANAVMGGISASQGGGMGGALGGLLGGGNNTPSNPSSGFWDNITNTDSGSNKTGVTAMVVGGVVIVGILLLLIFKKK
jgi:hypothetical protein